MTACLMSGGELPPRIDRWRFGMFRPYKGAEAEVHNVGSYPEPVDLGPTDLTDLWNEISGLYDDPMPPGFALHTRAAAYTRGGIPSATEGPTMDSLVKNERVRGVLGQLEIDFVLAREDSWGDPTAVLKALHLEVGASERPMLFLRGETAWIDRAERVIHRFCLNRKSSSFSKRLTLGVAVWAVTFVVISSIPFFLGTTPAALFGWAQTLGFAFIIGLLNGLVIYINAERWFPVSRMYADPRSGDPKWYHRWAETLFLALVAALLAAWILAVLKL